MKDCPPMPPGFRFGKEKTIEDIRYRIAWETWAAETQRELNHEALAVAHDLTKIEYEKLLIKRRNGN